ncbi:MAG: single-stranded DNA-binding protein [Deltaproteobacteria bacterium]|nr:single-stranded DNA-binding protein [Deltaproteobacteria bacterium]
MDLVRISRDLCRAVARLEFGPPVVHVYNPLAYARAPHERYLRAFGAGPREAVLLGMNPGPFGMAQTGVPFGDPHVVRDWLGISDAVGRPEREHPRRPILGFGSPRHEVSGTRLWGWARDTFGEPARFFARFFVANYCPLCFLEASGLNRTPDKLPAAERVPLFAACDDALRALCAALQPRVVIGVGAFAAARAAAALAGTGVRLGRIPHPSPASPRANVAWAADTVAALAALGVSLPRR